jgi:hypothetical protein
MNNGDMIYLIGLSPLIPPLQFIRKHLKFNHKITEIYYLKSG